MSSLALNMVCLLPSCLLIILGAYLWENRLRAVSYLTTMHSKLPLQPPICLHSDPSKPPSTTETEPETEENPLTFIPVDGAPNLRGFGGYTSTLPGTPETRKGHLFRSAHPGGLTENGMAELKSLGIKYIIDLTSPEESTVDWNLDRKRLESEGFVFVNIPMEKERFSIDSLLKRYDTYKEEREKAVSTGYIDLLTKGAPAITQITQLILDHPHEGKLIHCSLGKDRTGIVFALLLMLLDVPAEVIAREYSLSTSGLQSCIGNIERFLVKAKGDKIDARQHAERMVDAREEYMVATIREFRETFGHAEDYLVERCGLLKEDVSDLQRTLIDGL